MKKRKNRTQKSNLSFGTLEPRQLMAGDLGNQLSTDWFFQPEPNAQQVQTTRTLRADPKVETQKWSGQQAEVQSGEWLIQVSQDQLNGRSPVEVVETIQNTLPNVEVISGTGRVGQLHVRTSLSYQNAMKQFDSSTTLAAYEPVQVVTATDFEVQNSVNDRSGEQWALNRVEAPDAWSRVDGE